MKGKKLKYRYKETLCPVCKTQINLNKSNPNHCDNCKNNDKYVRLFAYGFGKLETIIDRTGFVEDDFFKEIDC